MISMPRLLFYSAPPGCADEAAFTFTLADNSSAYPWSDAGAQQFESTYRRRFDMGHQSVFLRDKGELVYTSWIARASLCIDEIGWTWRLGSTQRCIYDCVTGERMRGRGVYPAALRWTAAKLCASDSIDLWIYADARNAASLRGILKAGFIPRGSVASLWFGRRLVWRSFRVQGLQP